MINIYSTSDPNVFYIEDDLDEVMYLNTKGAGCITIRKYQYWEKIKCIPILLDVLLTLQKDYSVVFIECLEGIYFAPKERILEEGLKRKSKNGKIIYLPKYKWTKK